MGLSLNGCCQARWRGTSDCARNSLPVRCVSLKRGLEQVLQPLPAYHLADGKPLRSGTPLTAFASSSMPTSPLREEGALTTEHPAWSAVVRHKRFIYIRQCRAAELFRWLSSFGRMGVSALVTHSEKPTDLSWSAARCGTSQKRRNFRLAARQIVKTARLSSFLACSIGDRDMPGFYKSPDSLPKQRGSVGRRRPSNATPITKRIQ